MKKILINGIFTVFLATLMLTIITTTAKLDSAAGKATLVVTARDDKPGPVSVRVEGWDVRGNPTTDINLVWDADDNSFSALSVEISKKTRVLRFTFLEDYYIPGDPDTDRNAYIDYFKVNNLRYEAEDWSRTGGTDSQYPGAEKTSIDGRTVADCGNQGDWVEYDLHPGNPVGPGAGSGKRIGPKS